MPLINVNIPANALAFSKILMVLADLQILPHELINSLVFNFESSQHASKEVNPKFLNYGFSSNNFILNTGSIFWFIVIWVFIAIILCLMWVVGRFVPIV
jgi:hypothetical protein